MTTTAGAPIARRLPPVLVDLVCVLAFAAAGKASHEPGRSEWVVLAIVWPYAVAVVLAHAGLLARGRDGRRVWPEGAVVVAVTYVLGVVLRVMSGRGIAVGFLVVAVLFLAATMLGWRLVLRFVTTRLATRRAVRTP